MSSNQNKMGEYKDSAVKKTQEMKDGTMQKMGEFKDSAAKMTQEMKDGTMQKMGEFKDSAEEMKDSTLQKMGEYKDTGAEKAKEGEKDSNEDGGILSSMGNAVGAIKEKFTGPTKD